MGTSQEDDWPARSANTARSPAIAVSRAMWLDDAKVLGSQVELGAIASRQDASLAAFPLTPVLALFALAFLVPAWPWLSGKVTIPWDAKSQFLPPLQFLATALATHQSPLWTPNVFAGWPLISDPQSLFFSPLHVLLVYFDRAPSFRAVDAVTFAYLFLGGTGIILYFRDRGWHAAGALVAALTFAFGCSASSRLQHTNQIIDIVYFALTLWILSRALQRSSLWAGAAAGVLAGLLAIGREQVAMICLYVLFGFIVAHWLGNEDRGKCLRASIKPLAAFASLAALIAAVPVTMTLLLCVRSNRPEIAWPVTAAGSLHPAQLLTLAIPDLFSAMKSSDLAYWGPGTWPWKDVLGGGEVKLAKGMGLIYAGALPLVATVSFGIVRGHVWSREIRPISLAAAVVLLYAIGRYTPVFHVMYDLLPGVTLFRRPADATFVFGVLLAIVAGYLVHCWLEGAVRDPSRVQRTVERAIPVALCVIALALAHIVVTSKLVLVPVVVAVAFAGGAIAVLAGARRLNAMSPAAAVLLLTTFVTADLAWNNAPNISNGRAPQLFDVLRPGTGNGTLALLKSKLAADAAPDRRDRVELTGIGYFWPNLCMIQGCDHVFGHNPLRLKSFYDATGVGDTVASYKDRVFSPLFPSYRSALADLLGLRFIAVGVPIGEIDPSLHPGDLTFIGRTKDAYVYENPRALPRVMLMTDWRIADFSNLVAHGWPSDVDPGRTVLLQKPPGLRAAAVTGAGGTARLARYANTEVDVDVDAPSGGILLLNDVWHPWWRATVDGKATAILKADVIFRAVVVPPGTHTVRFTFHPFEGAFAEVAAKLRALL